MTEERKELYFYNSYTRKKEKFSPIDESEVRVYSCGPTVYNFAHIGNFRAYVFSDVLHRTLRLAGYEVKLVMNLTDIDDKTIRSSKEAKLPLDDYTKKYKTAFFEDLKTLRILPAALYPAATEHIGEMLEIIKTLKEKGHAYESDGSVYFSIKSFENYGKLANLKKDDLLAGASGRVSNDEYEKESVSDFALWKAYEEDDGEVVWDSEFGRGRPGWHIECSAMSTKYLGNHFDIHTGGIDNKFPHHENEIAQSECAFSEKFVNYWLHCDYLIVDGEKMSKSKGNFYTLRDLIEKGYNPKSIRYLLLSSHYRKPLNFTLEGVKQAASAIERIEDLLFRLKDVTSQAEPKRTEWRKRVASADDEFKKALYDDLNTAGALGVVFELVKDVNTGFEEIGEDSAKRIVKFFKTADALLACLDFHEDDDIKDDEINALIEERINARKEKNFARADEIRDMLKEKGIELLDTPSGTKWKKIQ